MKKVEQTAKVMGQSFFSKHKPELLNTIALELKEATKPLIIFTPNPEHLVMTREKPDFARTLQLADWRLPDGVWVVIASRLLSWVGKSEPIAERIPGVEFAVDLLQMAAEKNWKVLLVGGRNYHGKKVEFTPHHFAEGGQLNHSLGSSAEWVIEKLSQNFDTTHQRANATTRAVSLRSIYWLEAYQVATNPTVKEEIEVKKQLEVLQPDLVLVALGAPWQEQWIMTHYDILKDSKVKIAMVVGGAFDMLTGQIKRAPLRYRKVGLEWLHRLQQQPWRWKRQLRLFRFLFELFKEILLPS